MLPSVCLRLPVRGDDDLGATMAVQHNRLKKLRLPPHTALGSRVALSCVQAGQGRVWVLVGLGVCAMKILSSV